MTEQNDEGRGGDQPAENGDGDDKERLSDQLGSEVETQLVEWQSTIGRDGIRQKVMEAYWPGGTQVELLQWMVARTEKYQGLIKTAQDKGQLYPWIVPYPAACLFESMFQACVGVWLVAGEPDQPDKLSPSVKDYVSFQARTFGAMVGS